MKEDETNFLNFLMLSFTVITFFLFVYHFEGGFA